MLTDDILNKLKVIDLDLSNIPDSIKNAGKIRFRPQKIQDEKNYKIYKYINIKDIDILVTPTNRLTDLNEKYLRALPIYEYLKEENTELFETFIKLVKQISEEDIKELENQQNSLKNEIPLDIKFERDYLWQIYYSEEENKYFMLAPITDTEYAQLFFLLKKKFENSDEKIYVPICNTKYSDTILLTEEIKKLENAMWLFTNNWTNIYEVYNKQNEMTLIITGKTRILETVQGSYIMRFTNREEALEFYNTLQTLFTLQTNYTNIFNFRTKVLEDGKVEFLDNETIVNSSNIVEYIKNKYSEHDKKIIRLIDDKLILEEKLKKLKELSLNKQHEFLEKEKQISTYLECKKTFLGKVKYYFKYKKVKVRINNVKNNFQEEQNDRQNHIVNIEAKTLYTIQELMEITKELQEKNNIVSNLELDIEAQERRIKILDRKIENANMYIKEIDSHKKSIFDFWKFTSKDEANQLAAALDDKSSNRVKKKFNIDLDLIETKEKLDNIVRNTLSKNDLDKIFITTTPILNDLNKILNNEELNEENLIALKEELRNNRVNLSLNLINNNKIQHRETSRSLFNVLSIEENSTIYDYSEMLKRILDSINTILENNIINMNLPVYMATYGTITKGLNKFVINPEEILKNKQDGFLNIYKLTINDKIKSIPLTNIVYFNNLNKTLPVGMDCGTEVLVDTSKFEDNYTKKQENNILTFDNNKIHILKVNIYEI